ncbi:hypothetical protein KAU33_08980 [Candidatus Dependentiae bacterium]|nr:hypothetical protein [Candidatus Dependentiae bacterium]
MEENKEEKMDWEELEIRLLNCFWRMFILVAVLRIVQTTPDIVEQFIVLMGLLWILHGFKITIAGTLKNMKKKRQND